MASINPHTPEARRAAALLAKGFRPAAVDRALGVHVGYCAALRAVLRQMETGHKGLKPGQRRRYLKPVTRTEYEAACRAARVAPDPDLRLPGDVIVEQPWPHLVREAAAPRPARNAEAAAQAARIRAAAASLRYVPAAHAGGGVRHFARECAEHLADLIAYAPGPRYRDDPRAALPEPRYIPDIPPRFSPSLSPLADLQGAAS